MTTFADIVDTVYSLPKDELQEIKSIIDRRLTEQRINEIEQALIEAKQESASGKLKYYSSGKDMLASLNED